MALPILQGGRVTLGEGEELFTYFCHLFAERGVRSEQQNLTPIVQLLHVYGHVVSLLRAYTAFIFWPCHMTSHLTQLPCFYCVLQ